MTKCSVLESFDLEEPCTNADHLLLLCVSQPKTKFGVHCVKKKKRINEL